ncbi:MAG TPA: GGDEF domain-containing protein [Solirubrobacteraceae bacterium]|nr:GGDEF domain-containing protein [Solirubrobacteraceae bacterium]
MGSTAGDLAAALRRERLLDMEARIGVVRRRAFAVLALALIASGPWIGLWFLIPLATALVASTIADRLVRTRTHAHRWAAVGWGISGVMIAVSVALTGEAGSPAVMWMALPAVTLGARFELRGVLCGVGFLIALMLLSTLALDAGAVFDRPDALIFPIALVIATAIFSGATQASDREHRREAVLDPLTGLLNRAALLARFDELEQLAGHGEHASLGMLVADLDHFKRVNDEHGHPVGDAVLRDIAYAMRKALRAFDLVYRIGGEEFVVLLPGADLDRTVDVGERLRAAVAEQRTGDIAVTMSLGAAAARGSAVRFTELYGAADAALYAAKRAGRDRVSAAGSRTLVVV